MYLTYDEYISMGGTTSVNEFDDYEFEAEALINYVTFNRLKKDSTFPVELKRLMKYIIDLVAKKAASLSLGSAVSGSVAGSELHITNQSNDGVSVSYNSMTSTDLFQTCNKEITDAINKYLYCVTNEAGRYLLYRGLYPGE